jgi:hypothetical protein
MLGMYWLKCRQTGALRAHWIELTEDTPEGAYAPACAVVPITRRHAGHHSRIEKRRSAPPSQPPPRPGAPGLRAA